MADGNDTTATPYSEFSAVQSMALYETRAGLEGAIALVEKDPSWQSRDESVCIRFILKEVSRKLEAIADNIVDSEIDYTNARI